MTKIDWKKEIEQFPEEYATMVKLPDQQKRVIKGKIKSNEGMIFGAMYSDWKTRRGFDDETD